MIKACLTNTPRYKVTKIEQLNQLELMWLQKWYIITGLIRVLSFTISLLLVQLHLMELRVRDANLQVFLFFESNLQVCEIWSFCAVVSQGFSSFVSKFSYVLEPGPFGRSSRKLLLTWMLTVVVILIKARACLWHTIYWRGADCSSYLLATCQDLLLSPWWNSQWGQQVFGSQVKWPYLYLVCFEC